MKITADDLSRSYRAMSDGELLAMDQEQLTDMARKCLEQEMESRGLTHRDPAAPPAPVEIDGDTWVSAGMFQFADQARAYLPSLEDAEIPAELEEDADLIWIGSSAFSAVRLLVPASLVEDAQIVIENHARREELLAHEHADPASLAVPARLEDGVFKPLDEVVWDEGTEVEVRRRR